MKTTLTILLAAALAACGKSQPQTEAPASTPAQTQAPASPVEASTAAPRSAGPDNTVTRYAQGLAEDLEKAKAASAKASELVSPQDLLKQAGAE